jgi:hypothetical protein
VQKAIATRQKNRIARAAAVAANRATAKANQDAADAAAEAFRLAHAKTTAERFAEFKKRIVYKPIKGIPAITEREVVEVEHILEMFAQQCRDYTPTKIQRICNDVLSQKFDETQQRLKNEGHEMDELFMFHGTATANIKK